MKTQASNSPHSAEQAGNSIEALRHAAADCHACPLWENATQTVFGEGPGSAPIMLIGEQPGDQEDIAGRPFVGPAGQLLARALAKADIPREAVYITNAVKHFKYGLRGKRRMHKKPVDAEINACYRLAKARNRTGSPPPPRRNGCHGRALTSWPHYTRHGQSGETEGIWDRHIVADYSPSFIPVACATARQGQRIQPFC